MLLGYFDYIFFAVLIFLNFRFWNRKINWKVGCIIGGLSFSVFLPILSIVIELTRVEITSGPWMDSFEVVYTFLRFPTYWIVGIIQAIIIGINLSHKKQN
ncbi:hypothetical protein DZ858_07400 [Marixanthomonas ophiurae]|uniref:Lycopene cyclase domain-containing protein n=1 Tax=Marixanthomonas ophiurae TaxID=387659 RepID=A0A3E1QCN8_9FLAO|nr:hypothetical protein DZ858_07400 [Marixanthomonas ophiurae]